LDNLPNKVKTELATWASEWLDLSVNLLNPSSDLNQCKKELERLMLIKFKGTDSESKIKQFVKNLPGQKKEQLKIYMSVF
jgi:hypothetical protein